MAFSFGDTPPQDFVRSEKGWLKRKKSAIRATTDKLKQENADLKDRLAQLEAAVEQLVSKKKK